MSSIAAPPAPVSARRGRSLVPWCVGERPVGVNVPSVLILAILGIGMGAGALAQVLLGRANYRIDWKMALIAGFAGSFVGGLLASLIFGDGLALRPSGLIGSTIGAVIVTALWLRFSPQKAMEASRDRRR